MTHRTSIGAGIRWFSIGAGVLCLLLAAVRCPLVMGFKKTTGVIDSIYKDRDESGRSVMMVGVTYTRYRGTDRWQVGHSFPLGELSAGSKVGDGLTLYFDPEHKNAWLASGIWTYPLIGFGLGGLLIAVGLFAASRRSIPPPYQKDGSHVFAT